MLIHEHLKPQAQGQLDGGYSAVPVLRLGSPPVAIPIRLHPSILSGGSQLHELELVVFDLAGTTVEDHGQVPGAFTAALAEHGIEVTREQVKGVRGSSKHQALLHFIPAGPEQARLAEEVYASFRRTWRSGTPPKVYSLYPARSRHSFRFENAASGWR